MHSAPKRPRRSRVVSFRPDPALHEQLKAAARQDDRPISAFVRRLLQTALNPPASDDARAGS